MQAIRRTGTRLRSCSLGFYLAVTASLAAAPVHAQQPDQARVDAITRNWPQPSQSAARAMVQKYGPPQEATATMLIWLDNSPWERTVVHRTPVEHDFPAKHMDVLEQVVAYRVPLNFFTPLATFDGSIVADRTRGELAAFGDTETTNILALNLAQDIIRGTMDVTQARHAMAEDERQIMAGNIPPDASALRLPPPQGDLRDPDTPVITAPPEGRAVMK